MTIAKQQMISTMLMLVILMLGAIPPLVGPTGHVNMATLKTPRYTVPASKLPGFHWEFTI